MEPAKPFPVELCSILPSLFCLQEQPIMSEQRQTSQQQERPLSLFHGLYLDDPGSQQCLLCLFCQQSSNSLPPTSRNYKETSTKCQLQQLQNCKRLWNNRLSLEVGQTLPRGILHAHKTPWSGGNFCWWAVRSIMGGGAVLARQKQLFTRHYDNFSQDTTLLQSALPKSLFNCACEGYWPGKIQMND